MRRNVTIGLVGDYNESVPAHQAIPVALQRAAETFGIAVGFEWIPTEELASVARISRFDGVWCVPASPYRSVEARCSPSATPAKAESPSLALAAAFSTLSSSTRAMSWGGPMQSMPKRPLTLPAQ